MLFCLEYTTRGSKGARLPDARAFSPLMMCWYTTTAARLRESSKSGRATEELSGLKDVNRLATGR